MFETHPGGAIALPGALLSDPSRRFEETQGWAAESSAPCNGCQCPEVTMVLFSRSFIRKRVLSLATTLSITATSFALAQDPASTREVDSKENPFLTENAAAMKKMMADMMIKPSGDVDRD